jgi:hypothetical protein
MNKPRAKKFKSVEDDAALKQILLDEIHPPGGLHREDKDSRLTGATRSLERRVLGLRVADEGRRKSGKPANDQRK